MRKAAQRLSQFSSALGRALRSPTIKQKEAYARYCHTLSAAMLIAGGALPFAAIEIDPSVILRATAAALLAVLLFVWGALLIEERWMDWPLVIMLILGGLVCAVFGWIYFNSLSASTRQGESGSDSSARY